MPNGCWLVNKQIDKSGYVRFWIGDRRVMLHRYSYELARGDIPEGLDLLHSCPDARNCVNPMHLRIGNDAENAKDKKLQGRQRKWKSQETNLAILNNEKVIQIKNLLETQTVASVARQFGMSYKCIWNIKHFRSWKFTVDELRKQD